MEKTYHNDFLKKEEIAFFFAKGYLLVKNVYDKNDLNNVRDLFTTAFENEIWRQSKYNSPNVLNDIYRNFPGLIDIVINEKYISAIKSLLGEKIVWLPECAVHHNRFINWHNDTTEQEIKGVKSHKNPGEYLLQCATYFQSNSDNGGGLTLLPGTHVMEDRFLSLYKKDLYNRIKNKVQKIGKASVFDKINKCENAIQVPSELGDLLIFDVRIDHKSTGIGKKATGAAKFAIFNTFGNENECTKDYLQFMKTRPEPSYLFMQNIPVADTLYEKALTAGIAIWE